MHTCVHTTHAHTHAQHTHTNTRAHTHAHARRTAPEALGAAEGRTGVPSPDDGGAAAATRSARAPCFLPAQRCRRGPHRCADSAAAKPRSGRDSRAPWTRGSRKCPGCIWEPASLRGASVEAAPPKASPWLPLWGSHLPSPFPAPEAHAGHRRRRPRSLFFPRHGYCPCLTCTAHSGFPKPPNVPPP